MLCCTTLDIRFCSWLGVAAAAAAAAAAAVAAVAAASIAAAQHEAGANSRLGKDSKYFANLDIMTQKHAVRQGMVPRTVIFPFIHESIADRFEDGHAIQ